MTDDLKRILIIRDDEPLWADVKKSLIKTNAAFFIVDQDSDLAVVERIAPALLIMNSDTYLRLPPTADGFMKIVIKKGEGSTAFLRSGSGRKVVMIDWPQEESVLCALTSRLLSVSPRRLFKALIRIMPKDDSVTYMGESEDFSLTGIGFKTTHMLQQGEEVEISFSEPVKRQAANFEAEIVRRVSGSVDQAKRYGARYVNLNPDMEAVMKRFIRSI